MQSKATTIQSYIEQIPDTQKETFLQLHKAVSQNIPKGFSEQINYGMIGWVVPFETYPAGYHCDPKLPLPFLSIAAQKNFIAFYHMGIYVNPELYNWFIDEFPKHSNQRLDMGKSCVRFKAGKPIPTGLIGELAGKMTVQDWIALYETNIKPRKK